MNRRLFLGLGAYAASGTSDMVETARIQEEIPGHLVIRGAIDAALGGETIYELPRLQQLPSVSFKTITPWTTGAHTFKGVNLKTLMAAVGARGSIVRATALNDYAITIDLSDSAASLAIVAYEEDGQPIRVRDKGPLWILFPFSDHPELLTDRVEGWSIWQLDAIEVLAP